MQVLHTVLIVLGVWCLVSLSGLVVWCLCHGPRRCEGCGRILEDDCGDLCARCARGWWGGAA